MVTERGELWEGVLPGVLRRLYVGRRTGSLAFHHGDERCGVRFRLGNILSAETNVRGQRLGEMFVRSGRLSEAGLKRAMGFMLRDRKRLGTVLMDMGLLDVAGLEEAVAAHAHEVLKHVFSWTEGSYEFEDEPVDKVLDGDVTLRLSTGELILQAAREVRDPDVVRYNLGDTDRVLTLSSDPLLRYQRIGFDPVDGYVLSRVDGTLSAREIIQITPLPFEDVQRSLFGLLSTGVIEYLGDQPKPRPRVESGLGPEESAPLAPPPPASSPAALPETARTPEAPPPPPTEVWPTLEEMMAAAEARGGEGPAPTEVWPTLAELGAGFPSPASTAPTQRMAPVDTRRLEILEAHDSLGGCTHFEVLGVPRDATEAQVREAYFRLAKRFHPDVHHDAALSDLRDKLEEIFARLGEAYEVLCSPRIRASYERELARREGSQPSAAAASEGRDDAERADEAIRLGRESLAQERYWEAIRLFESAILRAEGALRQEARVLLARAYSKNPGWVKQGEELLLAVLREQPENTEAWLHLGRIYSGQGLRNRAFGAARRVLELQPAHPEATALLAELGTEGAPSLAESRSLLAKLFGSKSGP